jgi:hypothetical protein
MGANNANSFANIANISAQIELNYGQKGHNSVQVEWKTTASRFQLK